MSTHDAPSTIHDAPPSGRVLIIAGSDSGGGAGIQGDIKTVSALGGYAMTALTALTAQNTLRVSEIFPIPTTFIAEQITMCLSDIGADAIKTGMLHSAGVIETVVAGLGIRDGGLAATLAPFNSPLEGDSTRHLSASVGGNLAEPSPHQNSPSGILAPPQGGSRQSAASSPPIPNPQSPIPLVVDPVMVAKGGAPLLEAEALDALKTLLIPSATIITPNLPEAELLLGRAIASGDAGATDMKRAAEELLKLGCQAVLLKGGHGSGNILTDILAIRHPAPSTQHLLNITTPRIATRHTHGTGCALASAIATGLAQKLTLEGAVMRAHAYVQTAIARAPGFGAGNGPLGH